MSIAPRPIPLSSLVAALSGPIVWMLHLSTLYAVQTVLCAVRPDLAPNYVAIALFLTFAALAALVVTAHSPLRRWRYAIDEHRFLDRLNLTLSGLSGLAILWTASGALVLPACGT